MFSSDRPPEIDDLIISVVIIPSWNKLHAAQHFLFRSLEQSQFGYVPEDHCEFGLTVRCAMHSSFSLISASYAPANRYHTPLEAVAPRMQLDINAPLAYRGAVTSLTGFNGLCVAALPVGAVATSCDNVDFCSAIDAGTK